MKKRAPVSHLRRLGLLGFCLVFASSEGVASDNSKDGTGLEVAQVREDALCSEVLTGLVRQVSRAQFFPGFAISGDGRGVIADGRYVFGNQYIGGEQSSVGVRLDLKTGERRAISSQVPSYLKQYGNGLRALSRSGDWGVIERTIDVSRRVAQLIHVDLEGSATLLTPPSIMSTTGSAASANGRYFAQTLQPAGDSRSLILWDLAQDPPMAIGYRLPVASNDTRHAVTTPTFISDDGKRIVLTYPIKTESGDGGRTSDSMMVQLDELPAELVRFADDSTPRLAGRVGRALPAPATGAVPPSIASLAQKLDQGISENASERPSLSLPIPSDWVEDPYSVIQGQVILVSEDFEWVVTQSHSVGGRLRAYFFEDRTHAREFELVGAGDLISILHRAGERGSSNTVTLESVRMTSDKRFLAAQWKYHTTNVETEAEEIRYLVGRWDLSKPGSEPQLFLHEVDGQVPDLTPWMLAENGTVVLMGVTGDIFQVWSPDYPDAGVRKVRLEVSSLLQTANGGDWSQEGMTLAFTARAAGTSGLVVVDLSGLVGNPSNVAGGRDY